MAAILRVHAIDLFQFRAMLGSGEERFCAKVLKRPPAAAERLGLLQEWKRGVTGFVLGDAGEALAQRLPFEKTGLTQATPGEALAFASILEGFAQDGLADTLPLSKNLRDDLVQRPLFGLDSQGSPVLWGWLGKADLRELATHPIIAPIHARGLDVVTLSGSAWTDGEPGRNSGGAAPEPA